MGKKKQSKRDRIKEELRYRRGMQFGLDKDTNNAMERYGIDRTKYASSGAISQGRVYGKESYKQMEEDLLQAARSDYHTNRAIEASAMSGNPRAQKFADNGIRDVRALMHVQDMQGKQHKRLVGDGDFSSPSDYASLTYALVQKDRNKLMEDLQAKEDAATPDAAPAPPPEPQFSISEEADFDRDQERDERISEYENNRASAGLLGSDDSQRYMQDYKFNVASGLNGAGVETRGANAPLFVL